MRDRAQKKAPSRHAVPCLRRSTTCRNAHGKTPSETPLHHPDALELLIGLQDLLKRALARAVAAIGVRVEALHQLLVAGLDRNRIRGVVEAERIERLARHDAD